MADEISGTLIKNLPEATQSQLTNNTDIIVEDETPVTRRAKLLTLFNWIKSKLGSAASCEVVQNATTRDPNKIASAAVTADLQDQINEQNTKMSPMGSFTGVWMLASLAYGMGFVALIPKKNGDSKLTVTSARVYSLSGWHNVNVAGITNRANCWAVSMNISEISDIESGKTYLVDLSGSIS